MDREEILQMAKEAEVVGPNNTGSGYTFDRIVALCKLVAAAEREACAKAALNAPIKTARQEQREACAAAIRSKS